MLRLQMPRGDITNNGVAKAMFESIFLGNLSSSLANHNSKFNFTIG
jgi:hypothetical protein